MTKKILTPSHWVGSAAAHYRHGRQRRLAEMESWVGVPEPGTKWIPLPSGKRAIVDEEDFEFLNHWNWSMTKAGYAFTRIAGVMTYMHRIILKVPVGLYTDHINHSCVDNRKSNLRICTQQKNLCNRLKTNGTTSRFKGVSRRKNGWDCAISANGKRLYRGLFKNEEDAARKYNEQARIHFGEFAILNQI